MSVHAYPPPGAAGGTDGAGGGMTRDPQSVQSVPRAQPAVSAPGPPSLQLPLEAQLVFPPVHVFVHNCAGGSTRVTCTSVQTPLQESLHVLVPMGGPVAYCCELILPA